MKSKWIDWLVPLAFILISIVFFYPYFTQKRVPLPFNLLVSFYSPWKYEPGYGVGIPNKPLGDDNLKLFYPYRKFTIDELKAGHIPLWNPYTFSGSVNHAMYQSAVFYPLNVLYFIFPMVDAWSLIIMTTPILTGWFMYLFLRSLHLSRMASIFGSLAFALSGWMMAFWEEVIVKGHTILWLPLALYASNLVWDNKKVFRGLFLYILSVAIAILGGFPQMVIYLVITLLLWNTYRFFTSQNPRRMKTAILLAVAFMLAILIAAFQWVPALEAFLNAPRGKVDTFSLFEAYLTPLAHLVTFLAPDFWGNPGVYNNFFPFRYLQEHTIFIGIPAILFAFFALLNRKIPSFWKFFSLITLSMGFALPTSWILYTLKVPILNVVLPVRIFILATFGLCVLAAYGIEEMKTYKKNTLFSFPVVFFTLTLLILWAFDGAMVVISKRPVFKLFDESTQKIIVGYATVSMRNLIVPSVLFAGTALGLFFLKGKKFLLVMFMSLLTLVGAFLFASKILYFSVRPYEYPITKSLQTLTKLAGYNRIWSYGDGYIVRNIPSYFRLFSPEGYEALYSYRYGRFLYTIQTRGQLTDRIQRTDATLSETGQYESMTHNPVRLRLMSLLGVKYILEHKDSTADKVLKPEDRFASELFSLVWENDRWRIWEYRQALPRIFVAHQTLLETDPQKIVDNVLDPSVNLRETVIVEDPKAQLGGTGANTKSSATFVSYEPSEVVVNVNSQGKGMLFLSDTYYPGWKAFVDGAEQPIYRADFVLRAVPVSSGAHIVRFVYDPLSWKLGLALSGLGLVALILILIGRKRILSS